MAVPAEAGALESFREWARSSAFPESGRIDYLTGTIEVDMSPEELQSHGALKSELHAAIHPLVRYITGSQPGRHIEIEGTAALIVEIVSDSSVGKDRDRPALYVLAGVEEYWLADARGERLWFQIHRLEEGAYQPVAADDGGFQYSKVLGRHLRLRREPWELPDTWLYHVDVR